MEDQTVDQLKLFHQCQQLYGSSILFICIGQAINASKVILSPKTFPQPLYDQLSLTGFAYVFWLD